jgi:hypothetical protein
MEADMNTVLFSENAVADSDVKISRDEFLNNELKSMLADYLSGCVNVYDEIELKGKLIDYIRKM